PERKRSSNLPSIGWSWEYPSASRCVGRTTTSTISSRSLSDRPGDPRARSAKQARRRRAAKQDEERFRKDPTMRPVIIAIGWLTFVAQVSEAGPPIREPRFEYSVRLSARDPVTGVTKVLNEHNQKLIGFNGGHIMLFGDPELRLEIRMDGIIEVKTRDTVAEFARFDLE